MMGGNHTPTPWRVEKLPHVERGQEDVPRFRLWSGKRPLVDGFILDGYDAEFIVTAVNSYASSQAEIERLRAALEFYADPKRYEGPNQRADEGEKHRVAGYRMDVTRDGGEIARAALSGSKE